MLTYGQYKPWFVLNANDGTSGEIASSLAALGTYSTIGVSAEDVSYTHPWAVVKRDERPWDKIKKLCDATLCRLFLVSPSGYIKYRSDAASSPGATNGDLEYVNAITFSNQPVQANKIKIEGATVNEASGLFVLWNATSGLAALNQQANGEAFKYTLAAGDYLPPATDYPEGIECKYVYDPLLLASPTRSVTNGVR